MNLDDHMDPPNFLTHFWKCDGLVLFLVGVTDPPGLNPKVMRGVCTEVIGVGPGGTLSAR